MQNMYLFIELVLFTVDLLQVNFPKIRDTLKAADPHFPQWTTLHLLQKLSVFPVLSICHLLRRGNKHSTGKLKTVQILFAQLPVNCHLCLFTSLHIFCRREAPRCLFQCPSIWPVWAALGLREELWLPWLEPSRRWVWLYWQK